MSNNNNSNNGNNVEKPQQTVSQKPERPTQVYLQDSVDNTKIIRRNGN